MVPRRPPSWRPGDEDASYGQDTATPHAPKSPALPTDLLVTNTRKPNPPVDNSVPEGNGGLHFNGGAPTP
ncbi:hypothetical protein GCM10010357_10650 [Streptomyces luteireticuli]|uniref:Transposase n=1 Tax=Streptomyces luteireticuli TaxID=173858 RepID=A0ABN0YDC6_9ACTN